MEKSQNAAFKTSGSSTTELSSESVGKLLFKFSLPAIVAQLINVLYNMVDRMFIGHIDQIGPDALTGIGIVMPVIMCISAFAALVSMGGAARASIMLGRGDKRSRSNPRQLYHGTTSHCSSPLCHIPSLRRKNPSCLRRKRGHNFLCVELYENILHRYCLCTAYIRLKCIHHSTGFCQIQYDHRYHRCGFKYPARSNLYLCFQSRCKRSGSCYYPFAMCICFLCLPFSHFGKKHFKNQTPESQNPSSDIPAVHRTWCFSICHAVYRKHSLYLLQHLTS